MLSVTKQVAARQVEPAIPTVVITLVANFFLQRFIDDGQVSGANK